MLLLLYRANGLSYKKAPSLSQKNPSRAMGKYQLFSSGKAEGVDGSLKEEFLRDGLVSRWGDSRLSTTTSYL